jgi:hypothetical protein
MTGGQVEGAAIPVAMPVEGVAPKCTELEGATTGSEVPVAPEPTEEVRDDALLKSSMNIFVRLLEIQDAESIRSAPMSQVAPTSRGGLELLADNLIDPALVSRNFETMRRTKQWMKVREITLE